jgi:hypothetical protein
MYDRTDKRRIYQIMDMYLSGKITASAFCDEFHCTYNVELNHNTLKKEEHTVLSELGEVAGRCSEIEEDHKKYPGVYYTEEELRKKIIETKEKLKK